MLKDSLGFLRIPKDSKIFKRILRIPRIGFQEHKMLKEQDEIHEIIHKSSPRKSPTTYISNIRTAIEANSWSKIYLESNGTKIL